MLDILEEIFLYEQEANRPDCRQDPQYQSLAYDLHQQYQEIIKALGSRFLDEVLSLQSDQHSIEQSAWFRHGFQMAVRLMRT